MKQYPVVKLKDFALALQYKYPNITEETSLIDARRILSYFEFNGTAYDNIFLQNERNILYTLEESKILLSFHDHEEPYNILKNGKFVKKNWRLHYWRLNYPKIKEYSDCQRDRQTVANTEEDIYETLPEDVWKRS